MTTLRRLGGAPAKADVEELLQEFCIVVASLLGRIAEVFIFYNFGVGIALQHMWLPISNHVHGTCQFATAGEAHAAKIIFHHQESSSSSYGCRSSTSVRCTQELIKVRQSPASVGYLDQ